MIYISSFVQRKEQREAWKHTCYIVILNWKTFPAGGKWGHCKCQTLKQKEYFSYSVLANFAQVPENKCLLIA